MPITFSEADRRFTLGNRRKLKTFIEHVLCAEEGMSIKALSYVFCSDNYLLDINKRFLNHDYYTDIISFDLRIDKAKVIEGEIYISIDRVRDNSITLGPLYSDEFLRVIFHGVLHLCCYKDKSKNDIVTMRSAEEKYLMLYASYFT